MESRAAPTSWISPLAQANVLQFGAQIPSGPTAPAVTLDWDSVNANRPAWNARWNKTIER